MTTKFSTDASNNRVYLAHNVDMGELTAELISEGFARVHDGLFRREVNDLISGIHQFAFIVTVSDEVVAPMSVRRFGL